MLPLYCACKNVHQHHHHHCHYVYFREHRSTRPKKDAFFQKESCARETLSLARILQNSEIMIIWLTDEYGKYIWNVSTGVCMFKVVLEKRYESQQSSCEYIHAYFVSRKHLQWLIESHQINWWQTNTSYEIDLRK